MPIHIATADDVSAETAKYTAAIDVSKQLADGTAFALKVANVGVALFVRSADSPPTYKITLAFGGGGAANKQSIIDAFDWIFANSDAQVLKGSIASSNARCLAMVPQTWGYTLTDQGNGDKIYTLTKDAWASQRPKSIKA